jgi:outer membrane protein assembly factor BamB
MRRIALVVAVFLAPLLFTADRSVATAPRITTPGSRLWVARFAGRAGFDAATSVAPSPDGTRVFVTGASAGTAGNDFATLAYDASTGEQLWKTRYEVDTRRGATVAGMAVSPDGSRVFVTGSIFVRSDLYAWATVGL